MLHQPFIIDGHRVDVIVSYMRSEVDLIETTSFVNSERGYIPSGRVKLYLVGLSEDGSKVDGIYIKLSQSSNSITVLEKA